MQTRIVLLLILLTCNLSLGQNEPAPVKRTELQTQALPALDYRKVTVSIVEIAPGAAATKHQHPVAVFGYVLQGNLESQFEGDEPRTYRAGDVWYEPPGTVHVLARNPSTTEPVRLLVHYVGEEGQKLSVPVK